LTEDWLQKASLAAAVSVDIVVINFEVGDNWPAVSFSV
jgi:hypothetical protein